MMAPGHLDAVRAIVRDGGYDKVSQILEGADTRNDTTAAGAGGARRRGRATCCFHDAVRPLVSAAHHQRVRRGARRPTRPSTSPSRRPTRSSRSTPRQRRSATSRRAPACAAARPRRRSGRRPSARRTRTPAQDPDFAATDDCTVVLRYLPDVPICGRPRRRAQHEGHRADRRLHRRQALPAHLPATCPAPRTDEEYRAALDGKTIVVFGGSYGIGADIADARRAATAPTVHTFSRSSTNTHVERREDSSRPPAQVLERDRPDRLRGQHRRRAAPRRRWSRRPRRPSTPRPRSTTSAPILIAQEFFPHLRARRGAACCCSPRAPTPAAAAATASTPRPRRPWST